MPAFVKTAQDEKIWSKAKEISSQKFGNTNADSFYAYANKIFHNMKGLDESAEVPQPFIKTSEEDERYQQIREYVFNHPVYEGLTEDEKYDMIEGAHTGYASQGGSGELLEFVSSYMGSNGFGGMSSGGMGGSVGGVMGFGGSRSESPKGPYVFGSPGTDQGDNAGFKTDGDPAVVEIPDKKSNYKPWETELDNNGNTSDEVARAKEISSEDDVWHGPVGDVVTQLEDMGIDAEQLGHMTQEEIEDLLIKAVKHETATTQTQQTQQSVTQTKNIKEKIQEAFSFGEFMEKLDREGRIQKGRQFLANNLQKKEAIEKDEQTSRYKLDQYDIERTLSQAGYTYNYQSKQWVKKEPRQTSQEEVPVPVVEPTVRPEVLPSTYTGGTTMVTPEVAPLAAPEHTPIEPTPPKHENPDLMADPNIRHKMKLLQARFILGMAHNDKNSTEFTEDEKTKEKKPVVKDEDIANKIELLKYSWNPDKLTWLDSKMSLPHIFFNNGESSKTLIARSFLAAIGNETKIHINSTGKASADVANLALDMDAKEYTWNEEAKKWQYAPKDAKLPLNEDTTPQIPYNAEEAVEMCGRYLLRAAQIKNLRGAATPDVPKFEKELNDFDPTNIQSMAWTAVEDKLKTNGFVVIGGAIKKWIDSNTKHTPDCVSALGDDDSSFLGRGALAAKNEAKAAQFIAIQIIGKGTKNVKGNPAKRPEWIKQELAREKMEWDDDNGWVAVVVDKKKTNSEIDSPYKHATGLTKDKQKYIEQFRNANWDYMSSSQREKYKEYVGEEQAARELGIAPENWPQGNDPISSFKRSRYMRKFSQNYKFNTNPKTGEKGWIRRDQPVMRSLDAVGLKAAMGSVGRKLATTAKYSLKGGGALMGALAKLGSTQA